MWGAQMPTPGMSCVRQFDWSGRETAHEGKHGIWMKEGNSQSQALESGVTLTSIKHYYKAAILNKYAALLCKCSRRLGHLSIIAEPKALNSGKISNELNCI